MARSPDRPSPDGGGILRGIIRTVRKSLVLTLACLGAGVSGLWMPVRAQLPFTSAKTSGQDVSPAYEGWYRNADGSINFSFGYINRNATEIVDIPIGKDNFISPGPENQGQPTEFQPRRNWGVFAVKVPANFTGEVVWTLRVRGETYAIPAKMHPNWQIDALEGEAGYGNTPPVVKFAADGPEARGPGGITAGPVTATTSQPLALTVWASDDGKGPAAAGRAGAAPAAPVVTLAYFKHQGPGKVTFTPATGRAAAAGGQANTSVAFSAPGDYILRVRATDISGVANAGHAQCCWTNGFVKVSVK